MTDSPRLSSTNNPRVRAMRALHEAAGRKAAGAFLLEGPTIIREALAAGWRPTEAFTSQRLERSSRGAGLKQALIESGTRVLLAEERVLDAVSAAETHQGVVASAPLREDPRAVSPDPLKQPLLLVACGVQDPGNMGALVRIAEALGASALLAAAATDPWSPRAIRAAAGSSFRLPVARHPVPVQLARSLADNGYRLAAAVARGGQPPRPQPRSQAIALLVGSEGSGLGPELEALVSERLTIPLAAPVESLNVAAAAAILLYAFSESVPGSPVSFRREV